MSSDNKSTKSSMLSVNIKDNATLYATYMPFLTGGGLFIPTHKHYEIGSEIFLRLTLMDESDTLPVAGRVVWVTPVGAQGNRRSGIGIQFTDQEEQVRNKIETYLAGVIGSERPTYSM